MLDVAYLAIMCLFMLYRLRYPPYNERQLTTLQWLTKKSIKRNGLAGFFPVVVIGMVLAFFLKVIHFSGGFFLLHVISTH